MPAGRDKRNARLRIADDFLSLRLFLRPHVDGDPLKLPPAALYGVFNRVLRMTQQLSVTQTGGLQIRNGVPTGVGLREELEEDYWSRK